jgi:hypothetical protein
MKQILVTVKQVMEVPDSFQIGNYLKNDPSSEYLKVGRKFAAPDITWSAWQDGGDSPNCLTSGVGDEDLNDRLNTYTHIGYTFKEFPNGVEVDLNMENIS